MRDSVRLVRGTAYGDAKSNCAPGFSGVRRSAAAPDLLNWPIETQSVASHVASHCYTSVSMILNPLLVTERSETANCIAPSGT